MLNSDKTSQMNIWHLPESLPAWPHKAEAWLAKGWRTVARILSPRFRSCLTNSNPMPLDAPMISHVLRSSHENKMSGMRFIDIDKVKWKTARTKRLEKG